MAAIVREINGELVRNVLAQCDTVQSLDLSNNEIRVVENLAPLKGSLVCLNLSYNLIASIDFHQLMCLPHLEELYLTGNLLRHVRGIHLLHSSNPGAVGLRLLDLSYNPLDEPSILDELSPAAVPALRELRMRGTPLSHGVSYRETVRRKCPQLSSLDGALFWQSATRRDGRPPHVDTSSTNEIAAQHQQPQHQQPTAPPQRRVPQLSMTPVLTPVHAPTDPTQTLDLSRIDSPSHLSDSHARRERQQQQQQHQQQRQHDAATSPIIQFHAASPVGAEATMTTSSPTTSSPIHASTNLSTSAGVSGSRTVRHQEALTHEGDTTHSAAAHGEADATPTAVEALRNALVHERAKVAAMTSTIQTLTSVVQHGATRYPSSDDPDIAPGPQSSVRQANQELSDSNQLGSTPRSGEPISSSLALATPTSGSGPLLTTGSGSVFGASMNGESKRPERHTESTHRRTSSMAEEELMQWEEELEGMEADLQTRLRQSRVQAEEMESTRARLEELEKALDEREADVQDRERRVQDMQADLKESARAAAEATSHAQIERERLRPDRRRIDSETSERQHEVGERMGLRSVGVSESCIAHSPNVKVLGSDETVLLLALVCLGLYSIIYWFHSPNHSLTCDIAGTTRTRIDRGVTSQRSHSTADKSVKPVVQ
jgi:hypothetical protein